MLSVLKYHAVHTPVQVHVDCNVTLPKIKPYQCTNIRHFLIGNKMRAISNKKNFVSTIHEIN